MNEEKLKMYLTILNDENPSYVKENAKTNIITLFEKQQKEIKKLKSRKYILNAETNEIKEIPISENYISKDKIKEKIEELKQYKEEIKEEKDFEYFTTLRIIKTLKELLGE